MATISISGQAEFTAALKAAQAGDRLVLADGNYGTLTMTADFTKPVTIASANPLGASFAKVSLNGATNVHFDGLKMTAGFAATLGSKEISITNSTIDGTLYLRDAQGILVQGNMIDGGLHAILVNSVNDFQIRGNLIHTAQEDLMRITGDSGDGLVENNSFWDMHAEDRRSEGGIVNHADAIQMFGANGKTPHDIVIRGNHIWDDPATGAATTAPQGIFISDPAAGGYRNILIEENLINVRAGNSIYINGGQENVVVRNNTLIPGPGDGGGIIRLAEKSGMDNSGTTVTGNVMKLLRDETGASTITGNYIYGRGADLTTLFAGSGRNPWDFLPPNGSPIPVGVGAMTDGLIRLTPWPPLLDGNGNVRYENGVAEFYGDAEDNYAILGIDTTLALGGDGFDIAAYSGSSVPLDTAADLRSQGQTPMDDTPFTTPFNSITAEFEGLVGSRFADTLIGDDGDNWLIGGSGADTFNTTTADAFGSLGSGGNDVIIGDSIRLDELIGRHSGYLLNAVDNPGNPVDEAVGPLDSSGLLDLAGIDLFAKYMADLLAVEKGKDFLLGRDTGAKGNDTVLYSGNRDDYLIEKFPYTLRSGIVVDAFRITDLRPSAPDGIDLVTGVETFRFKDTTLTPALLVAAPPADIIWAGSGPSGLLPAAGAVVVTLTSIDAATTSGFTYAIVGPADGFAVNAATGVITRTAAMPQSFSTTLVLSSTDTTDSTLLESFFIASGSTAAETMSAHATRDSVLYGFDENDTLTGGAGNDNLFGQNGNDSLSGGAGNDTLIGGAGTDAILGGGGNDTIYHTLGDGGGTIDGGADIDTLQVFGSMAGNTLSATIGASGRVTTIEGNTLTGIEKITADLGSGTDTLRYVLPTGVSVNLTVDLQAGTATGFTSVTGIENVLGNIGNDRLTGNAAANSLSGGAGNDTLSGGLGNDNLSGGDGDDVLTGGAGTDAVSGGNGNDTINHTPGDGAGSIDGGFGYDTLIFSGTSAAETLTLTWNGTVITSFALNGLSNTVAGIEAIRVNMVSGTGSDTLAYSPASLAVTADLSLGTASGVASVSRVQNLAGGNGADRLTGNGSSNVLSGGAGNDVLSGGIGNDRLTGGIGADTMWGGTESDVFIFNSTAELGLGSTTRDVIMDFGSGDDLDFSGIDANALLAGDQAFTFLAAENAAFTASGQIRWRLGDIDNNGVKDVIVVELNTGDTLAADEAILLMNRTAPMVVGHFIL